MVRAHRRLIVVTLAVTVALVVLAAPSAGASDVYGNIGPAPQLPAGSLQGRFPLSSYQLDQYFPGISVGLGGVDTSGVGPLIAYVIAQIVWLVTAFVGNAVITLFAFAFNLDLLDGNGTPGSGALTPVATAIHNLYTNTFGAPWLVVAILTAGVWAMWKALVQRRYAETAGGLAVSLLYCVVAIGIVTHPQSTIAPASHLSNEVSSSILSLTSQGSIGNEQQAKTQAANQLFSLLILDPWTVLEFGGIEHCATVTNGKAHPVAVRPLSSNAAQDTQLASQLEAGTEVQAQGKTCINDRNKYAAHFLAYPYQSSERNAEHEALEHGDSSDLPDTDPAKHDGTYHLGPADEPAAEAMGKGGQYQRLLLTIVIFTGELGAFLLLGALALGVILAQLFVLLTLAFSPVVLLVAVFPGRGHEFFRKWAGRLSGYLARKVIYSLILAVTLAVSQALADASSNLGWLMAFALQAAFMWAIFLQRSRLTADFLSLTSGPHAAREGASRLQSFYYTTRLARMASHQRQHPNDTPTRGSADDAPPSPPPPSPTPPLPVSVPALPAAPSQLALSSGHQSTTEGTE
jgi:hypothetical protein